VTVSPWLLVALLWVVALLNYLDRQVIFSLFPLLERDLHAGSVELGLTSTVFLGCTAFSVPSPATSPTGSGACPSSSSA
jgi:hypothetical protein